MEPSLLVHAPKAVGSCSTGEGKAERGNLLCFTFSGKDAKGGMFILYVACQRAHYRVSDIVLRHMSGVEACSFPLFE